MKRKINIVFNICYIYCIIANFILGIKNANISQILLSLAFVAIFYVKNTSMKYIRETDKLYEEMYRMKTNQFLFLYKAVKNKIEEDKRYTHLVLGINKHIVNLVDLKEKYDDNN